MHEEGGAYANHPRNEGDRVIESRAESMRLAMEADVPLCVSHLKAAGRQNWGKPRTMLSQLDRAVEDGLRAMIDCYPYTAGCTSLNVSIPPRYFEKGMPGLLDALNSATEREIIRAEMSRASDYDNYVYNSGGFSGVYVASCPVDHRAEGMFVTEYAEKAGMEPFDAFCDILIRNNGLGLGIYFHMNEDDMTQILTHPLCVLGTDGLIGQAGDNPHPRAFGSTARAYDLLVRQKKLLTPEAMIHKMSGQLRRFSGYPAKDAWRMVWMRTCCYWISIVFATRRPIKTGVPRHRESKKSSSAVVKLRCPMFSGKLCRLHLRRNIQYGINLYHRRRRH